MKKIFYVLAILVLFSGCGMMNNTPTRKVEALLSKYQSNDSEVLDDLDNVLMSDYNLTDDERDDYSEFMSKHYQDMTYKVKDEKIDGDSATVDVEVTVRDYSKALTDANEYRTNNSDEFDVSNTFASYRLGKLKEVEDTKTYTIIFHLTKDGKEWKVDPLSNDDESKLNGTYGYSMINYNSSTYSDSNNGVSDSNSGINNSNNTSDNSTRGVADSSDDNLRTIQ